MTTQFCPQCGAHAATDDHFCRSCGASLQQPGAAAGAADEAPTAVSDSAPAPRRRRGPVLVGLGALTAALVAAGLVVLFSGVLGSGEKAKSPAAQDAVLRPMLDAEMRQRDSFFAAERTYDQAMLEAKRTLRRYRHAMRDYDAEMKRINDEFASEFDTCQRYIDVACPTPTYPDMPKAPSFSDQTKNMRQAAGQLEQLRVAVTSSTNPGALRSLHVTLLSAIEALKQSAERNADVFDEAVLEGGEDTPGSIDKGKIKTIRNDDELPSIRAMNIAAVRLVRRLQLPLTSYDVPGGRDLDTSDKSDQL